MENKYQMKVFIESAKKVNYKCDGDIMYRAFKMIQTNGKSEAKSKTWIQKLLGGE